MKLINITDRRVNRYAVGETSSWILGSTRSPAKTRLEARTNSCQVKRVRSIILSDNKILQHEVETCKNSQQGKEGGIDRFFVGRARIQLGACPIKNENNRQHLKSHAGISDKGLQTTGFRLVLLWVSQLVL
jgi:hypothetical protein